MDFAKVDLDQLRAEHPERKTWAPYWQNYRLLYKGGEEFLRAAGDTFASRSASARSPVLSALARGDGASQARRFLQQLDGEPDRKYRSRWERAFYIGYIGPMVDYFRSWLFSQPLVIRPESGNTPDWYDGFCKNADGAGTDFVEVVKQTFLDMQCCRRAGWLISSTSDVTGLSQAEAEAQGAHLPIIVRYPAEQILDWDDDDTGALKWVTLQRQALRREFPGERRLVETFTYADRELTATWNAGKDAAGADDLEFTGAWEHGLGDALFVRFELPEGLWLVNKLASWQVDLFNKSNMLAYGQLVSCFLQPFLKSNEPEAAGRVFGEGLMLHLRAGNAGDPGEEFGWKSPDVAPLAHMALYIREQRDEGYRIAHQMALAVDSQSIGAIARSGVSKIEDRRASEIVLSAYDGIIGEAVTRTLDLISRKMGDGTKWVYERRDFQVSSLDDELTTAGLVGSVDIPSPTFKKWFTAQLATGRLASNMAEEMKAQVRKEIDDAIDIAAESSAGSIEITPTAQGAVTTVNEARAALGLPAMVLPDGSPDPAGLETIAAAQAKADASGSTRAPMGGTPPGDAQNPPSEQ